MIHTELRGKVYEVKGKLNLNDTEIYFFYIVRFLSDGRYHLSNYRKKDSFNISIELFRDSTKDSSII